VSGTVIFVFDNLGSKISYLLHLLVLEDREIDLDETKDKVKEIIIDREARDRIKEFKVDRMFRGIILEEM
jgi:hypothetical protein